MEAFMPIPEEFWKIAPDSRRFIVSYPRSGSRWLRIVLADVLNGLRGEDSGKVFEEQRLKEARLDKSVPVFESEQFFPDVYQLARGAAAPSTYGFEPIYRSHDICSLRDRAGLKTVYLIRDPVPVHVSYFHFAAGRGLADAVEKGIDSFCLSRTPLWLQHARDALTLFRESPDRILIIQYGDQIALSCEQIAAVFRFFNIEAADDLIEGAVSRFLEFLNRITSENQFGYPRGCNAGSHQQLSAGTIRQIRELTEATLDEAFAVADLQSGTASGEADNL